MPSCEYGSRGWEFNIPGDTEGWKNGTNPSGNILNIEATGTTLKANIAGENSNPYFEEALLEPDIDSSLINIIDIRYRILAPGQSMAQFFWTHTGSDGSEIGGGKNIDFGIVADGLWHRRSLNLANEPLWDYLITAIRFDPVMVGNEGDTVEIDFIRLCSVND